MFGNSFPIVPRFSYIFPFNTQLRGPLKASETTKTLSRCVKGGGSGNKRPGQESPSNKDERTEKDRTGQDRQAGRQADRQTPKDGI